MADRTVRVPVPPNMLRPTVGLLCACCCLLLSRASAGRQPPVVDTESGRVSGTSSRTWTGRTVYGFQGIPYAAPPVGALRFQEAQPVRPWLGVWNATEPESKCIQYDHASYSIQGDEDCLYVNVFTPTLPKSGENDKLLDVLVFIHGGAFMFLEGSGYQPDYILDKDIVLVTFNYRLGPIGFFSTGDSVVSGNNGLKDQVQALKWIQRNIEHFGGDPKKVTISGMSAGGASVHYHMLSPLSKGLFHRAFSQSGTAMCPWALTENVPAKSAAIGAHLGCPTSPSERMVECLNSRPAKQIVEAVKMFFPFMYNPYSPFGPMVELPSDGAFISEPPYQIFVKGLAADVPWLSSVVTHEGLYPGSEFINDDKIMKYIDENWNRVIPHILDYNYTVPQEHRDRVSELMRKEYMGDAELARGNTDGFIQMIGDRLFVVDIIKAVQIHARHYKSPVYVYQFGYRGNHSLSELFSGSNQNYGASHADDTAYVLRNVYVNVEDADADRLLVPILVDIWTSFVMTGKPSTGLSLIDWTPVSKDPDRMAVPFLNIRSPTDIDMDEAADMGRASFWDSLGFDENENLSTDRTGR